MVERWTEAPCAAGSIPARPINGRYASGLKRAVCKTVGSCLRGFKSHPADLTVLYIQHTPVAQWTEHTVTNRSVAGSNPAGSAKKRWQSG